MAKGKKGNGKGRGRTETEQRLDQEVEEIGGTTQQTAQPMGNVTDKTLKDFIERACDAYDDHQKAMETARKRNAVYRGVLKDAKKAGIDPDDIIDYIHKRERDPSEIDAETSRRTRIAFVMGLPIGTQLGLFGDGQTVADRVERAAGESSNPAEKTKLQKEAKVAGRQAGQAGRNRTDNPWPLNSMAFNEWDKGWLEGQDENKKELGQGNKKFAGNGEAVHA